MRKELLLVIAAGALLFFSQSAHAATDVGQPAPALIATQLDGNTFDLSAQRGKMVVVNFWATWCAPCQAEMPALNAVYDRYHDKGLAMIGISLDHDIKRDDVTNVMRSFDYPAAMMSDAKTNGFEIPNVLPVTYVIDTGGVVCAILTPDTTPVTEASLEAAIKPHLEK